MDIARALLQRQALAAEAERAARAEAEVRYWAVVAQQAEEPDRVATDAELDEVANMLAVLGSTPGQLRNDVADLRRVAALHAAGDVGAARQFLTETEAANQLREAKAKQLHAEADALLAEAREAGRFATENRRAAKESKRDAERLAAEMFAKGCRSRILDGLVPAALPRTRVRTTCECRIDGRTYQAGAVLVWEGLNIPAHLEPVDENGNVVQQPEQVVEVEPTVPAAPALPIEHFAVDGGAQ